MTNKRKKCLFNFLILFSFSFLFLTCAINPVTRKWNLMFISTEQEVEIGKKADVEITEKYGYYEDEAIQQYIDKVGQKIASVCDRKDINYHFTVVDSPEVNAFALPGGYVYITRGILAQINSEAEMAGVLGHEVGHVAARHSAQQISKALTYKIIAAGASIIYPEAQQWSQISDFIFAAIQSGYGRDFELQSDELGVRYNERAGYNPKAVPAFLKHLKMNEEGKPVYHGLFASHPDTQIRIEKATALAEKIISDTGKATYFEGRDEYLSKIEGLIYGPGEKAGIFDGPIYRNSYYRFSIAVPQGWESKESRYLFAKKHPQKEIYIALMKINLRAAIKPEQLAQKWELETGAKRINGKNVNYRGINAFYALYNSRLKKGKAQTEIVFFVRRATGFAIIATALKKDYSEAIPYFKKTFSTLRAMTKKESSLFKNRRIIIYTVKEGDTLQSLAEKFFNDKDKVKELALINGIDKDSPLKIGGKLKIPVLKETQ
ncbi:MAG: LysM peptidoglycan-binding domain-containing protein [Candidatus Schekmanbacteria bacterium]|nr:MAG: LysM peptidoglycan-binding domain-containing protein [Candidatus Schekmanbacteria bacterium]